MVKQSHCNLYHSYLIYYDNSYSCILYVFSGNIFILTWFVLENNIFSFSIAIQPRFGIFCPHIYDGGYIHVSIYPCHLSLIIFFCHDITKILLKVALNTIYTNLILVSWYFVLLSLTLKKNDKDDLLWVGEIYISVHICFL